MPSRMSKWDGMFFSSCQNSRHERHVDDIIALAIAKLPKRPMGNALVEKASQTKSSEESSEEGEASNCQRSRGELPGGRVAPVVKVAEAVGRVVVVVPEQASCKRSNLHRNDIKHQNTSTKKYL